MTTRTAYRAAIAFAVGTAVFLVWGIGALGVLGTEGDPADRMYLGVLAIGVVGALLARFRATGMALAMSSVSAATVLVGLVALVLGKQHAEHSSVLEILGLTGMYAGLFAASAWLFRTAGSAPSHARTRH